MGLSSPIVGVTPARFTGLDRFVLPSIFVPLGMAQRLDGGPADPLENRGRHNLVVKGRLSAGASRESAQAELAIIGAALEREYPKTESQPAHGGAHGTAEAHRSRRPNCWRWSRC